MRNRRISLLLILTAFLVLAAVYFVADPSEAGWMPKCAFFQLTGLKCAGCGSQRAFHALLHGDFAEAWSQNAFMIVLIPVLLFLVWLELRRTSHPNLYRRVHAPVYILLFGVIVLLWTVGRNLL